MEWRDEGIVLAVRRHGESGAIAEVFTAAHGRHAGVVRGGGSRKLAGVLQPGSQVSVAWRARLEEHLGNFTVEPVRSRAGAAMAHRTELAGLASVCALSSFALAERQAYPAFYDQTVTMLDLIGESPLWPFAYLRWEAALLSAMGFGLDLDACAVTGVTEGLVFVSPRSGRAVSVAGAGDWADRLLPLPGALRGEATENRTEVIEGLATTGWFLDNRLAPSLGDRSIPEARQRLVAALGRTA